MPWSATGERIDDPLSVDGMRLVGAALKRRRVRLGLTQTRLERMTGIDQTTISRLESGRRRGLRWTRFTLLVAVLGGLDFGDLGGVGAYGRRRNEHPDTTYRSAWGGLSVARVPDDLLDDELGVARDPTEG